MSHYLHDIPLVQAQKIIKNELTKAGITHFTDFEIIPLNENGVGRKLAESVWAKQSSPHYHSSAMDGFATFASWTDGADTSSPVSLEIPSQARWVDTGDPLPDFANVVIPVEEIEVIPAEQELPKSKVSQIIVRRSSVPWNHVRSMGEDIVVSQLVLPKGRKLSAFDLGAIAASGETELRVTRKPIVGVIPTGTELIPIGQPLKRGDILEFNSVVLAGQCLQIGAEAIRYPIVVDDLDLIKGQLENAVETCDLVILNAGSSAGSEDYSARVIGELGEVFFHGVAVRPGHPVIFGIVRRKNGIPVPVFGVPGYPVSAALTLSIFIEPILRNWLDETAQTKDSIEASFTKKITSPSGDDDYVRVMVGEVNDRMVAAPLSRGAGVITSLINADGITIIPKGQQGLTRGDRVSVQLFKGRHEIQNSILCIGSHDLVLDILSQKLFEKNRRFITANVGSLGGLITLGKGDSHIAGSHLLNGADGTYNSSFIKEYLPELSIYRVGFTLREQGLLVRKGNPLGLKGIGDIVNHKANFVNRQKGSGTRILFDFALMNEKLSAEQVSGYDIEEFTHLNLAVAIASGKADCGLGIPMAAKALDLDFVPLFEEQYDLITTRDFYHSSLFEPLIETLNDSAFKDEVNQLVGYKTHQMGEILEKINCEEK